MSWKPSKVHLFPPEVVEDNILVAEKKKQQQQHQQPDLNELLLIGGKASNGGNDNSTPASTIITTTNSTSSTTLISSTSSKQKVLDESDVMPPPPPPPPPHPPPSVSSHQPAQPSASVSSTSEELSNDRADIEFDGNDQVLCRVCGDKASGFHYGVHSCEGCKGFFRRSIQQKIQYRPCTKNQQCNILRINRNRCQYCRLKKCIAAGMSRDAVRFGRVPKREKAKILAAMQSSRQKTQESRVMAEMADDGKIIETVVRAHYDTCDYTRNKMEPFIVKAKARPAYAMFTGTTCPMKGRPEDSFLDHFSERFMDHVRQVCNFAKMIPGFKNLHHDDQVTLLKSCVFEVLLVRLSGLFENQGLICLNGDIIRKETIDTMPQGNAKFLMDSVFDLAHRLNTFRMSDAEVGLFCAVVIITPDRPGLRSPELIQKMQNKLKDVLNKILLPQHPEHSTIFTELMTMIHDLRTLNTLHTEKFLQACKVNNSDIAATTTSESLAPKLARYPVSSHHVVPNHHLDREGSTGNVSPHSTDDTHSSADENNSHPRGRSPVGSVSSSESIGSTDLAKLTVHDLRVNNSVLMNALTLHHQQQQQQSRSCPFSSSMLITTTSPSSAATVTVTRKRSNSDQVTSGPHLTSTEVEIKPASVAKLSTNKLRKVDSPIDSGIDSPKAGLSYQESHSTNTSVCSSPRSSSMEDMVVASSPSSSSSLCLNQRPSQSQVEEQHPLLKRALQQPPQPYNPMPVASFQDEVYKPHKKFRRMAINNSADDCPSSSTSPPATTTSFSHGHNSLLISQLSEPPRNQTRHSLLASTLSKLTPMDQEQSKRNEIIANLILSQSAASSSTPSTTSSSAPPTASSSSSGLLMCALSSTASSHSSAKPVVARILQQPSQHRHIPVPALPTKPMISTAAAASAESKMSQLAAAAVATLAAEAAANDGPATTAASSTTQPLNLSKRTGAAETNSTSSNEGNVSSTATPPAAAKMPNIPTEA